LNWWKIRRTVSFEMKFLTLFLFAMAVQAAPPLPPLKQAVNLVWDYPPDELSTNLTFRIYVWSTNRYVLTNMNEAASVTNTTFITNLTANSWGLYAGGTNLYYTNAGTLAYNAAWKTNVHGYGAVPTVNYNLPTNAAVAVTSIVTTNLPLTNIVMKAGTTINGIFTAVTLTSGSVVVYKR